MIYACGGFSNGRFINWIIIIIKIIVIIIIIIIIKLYEVISFYAVWHL